jgi:hypothetical protein
MAKRATRCTSQAVEPNMTAREPNENNSTSEDRFGRQDQRGYSGWSSLIAIVIVVIIVGGLAYLYFGR